MKKNYLTTFNAISDLSINTTIICTTNYDILHPFKVNRYGGFQEQLEYTTEEEIVDFKKHVRDIKNSMISFGELRGFPQGLFDPREPIIVFNINGRFYVGDGQHRLAAAKALGIPFYIMIVESPFGVYDEETDTMRMDDNDEEFANEYFLRMNKEMQMRWKAASKISSAARANNIIAQYISNISNNNKYIKTTTLNTRMTFEVKNTNKKKSKLYKAVEYYELMQPSDKEISSMKKYIDEYVYALELITNALFRNEKFIKESSKENWLHTTYNYKYLGLAIKWIMNNRKKAESLGFLNWEEIADHITRKKIKKGNNALTPQDFLQKFGVCVGKYDDLGIE